MVCGIRTKTYHCVQRPCLWLGMPSFALCTLSVVTVSKTSFFSAFPPEARHYSGMTLSDSLMSLSFFSKSCPFGSPVLKLNNLHVLPAVGCKIAPITRSASAMTPFVVQRGERLWRDSDILAGYRSKAMRGKKE